MTMLFTTGHSTTFEHCAIEKCLYHAILGSDLCEGHTQTVTARYEVSGDEYLATKDAIYLRKSDATKNEEEAPQNEGEEAR